MSADPTAERITERYDEVFSLAGDEDCGVGLECRLCDRGGAPVAYYTYPEDRVYAGTDVEVVYTIAALIEAGRCHLVRRHSSETAVHQPGGWNA